MLGRSVNAWGLMVLATVFALPNANLVQAQPVNEASSLKATALTLAPHDAARSTQAWQVNVLLRAAGLLLQNQKGGAGHVSRRPKADHALGL